MTKGYTNDVGENYLELGLFLMFLPAVACVFMTLIRRLFVSESRSQTDGADYYLSASLPLTDVVRTPALTLDPGTVLGPSREPLGLEVKCLYSLLGEHARSLFYGLVDSGSSP